MESRIVLVRHSIPSIEVDRPSIDWSLSVAGKAAAIELAKYLSGFRVTEILSSPEKKAHQTAASIADRLALPICLDSDLREHGRSKVGYLARTDFEAGITRLLEHPHQLTFGDESADAVFNRMAQAVARARGAQPSGDLMIVTHGTAMSIYAARVLRGDPLVFWRSLSMPTAVVLNANEMKVIDVPGTPADR
ncbi:histidine phosphatase family protein [Rhizobium ruizarguesonis]|uniref:histidine phosphatase family protein n=1 Tax=Rhizobium ruizarguesonis TaxID=2081791 RepID=UPI001032197E|nr:histidine phosphatase family protein [Rhizobium ruizarguesonis]TBB53114.1 histidine phosphatase family protein [Rhizobium ruizarguesonis]